MLQSSVGCQNGVVSFHNSSGNLQSLENGKFQLGFIALVLRQMPHEFRHESRPSTTTERMDDEETLQPSALISLGGSLKMAQKNSFKNIGL